MSNGRAYILSTPNNDDDETNGMHVSTVIEPTWAPFVYRFLAAAPFQSPHTAYRLLFVFQFRRVRTFWYCCCHLWVWTLKCAEKEWPTLFHISGSKHLTPGTPDTVRWCGAVGRQMTLLLAALSVNCWNKSIVSAKPRLALRYAAQSVGGA